MPNKYYIKPFHTEYHETYHNGWLQAEADLKVNSFPKIRDDFNNRTNKKPSSLSVYYYDNGYFSYICQYANNNGLI